MVDSVIPTPRRITRTRIAQGADVFSVLGDAASVAGQAGMRFVQQDREMDERERQARHEAAMAEQKRQDDALYIEKAQEWIAAEEAMRQRAAELRQEGSYHDHGDRVRAELDQRFRAFDESLAGNERVRQRFRLDVVQSAARIDAQESAWQQQQQFKVQGEALEQSVTTLRNQLTRSDPDSAATDFAAAIQKTDQMIDAGAFNDDQAAAMKRAVRTQLAQGLNDGLFSAGKPEMVQALIDKGFYDTLDLDVSRIGEQVQGEKRALEIAAERAAKEKQIEARNAIDAIEAKIGLGINPTQAEMDQVMANARAAGLPEADLISFGGLSVQMGLNRQYSEAADPDGIAAGRAAAAIRAKIGAGTASEAEQVAYGHLQGVADARSKAAGARLKDMAGQGAQGKIQALGELQRLPRDQRFIAAQELGAGMGYVAQLAPRMQQHAIKGREIRAARPKDFGDKAQVHKQFRDYVGAVAGQLGGDFDEIADLAWDIYVSAEAERGREGFVPDAYRTYVDIALGGSKRSSDGQRQGGIGQFGKHKVILPTFQTEDEFEAKVRSLTFDKARYRDGSKVSKADIVRNYRPQYDREGPNGEPIYIMVDGSGKPLGKAGGGNYDFAVRP